MLPAYYDCARRAAAKQFRKEIEGAGFNLRETFPTVGAALGTSVHAANEYLLRHKIEHFTVGDEAHALDIAMQHFTEETDSGAEWDDTTPNPNTALFQMRRIVAACAEFAQSITPKAVELELRADAGDGFELTGHIDLLTAQGVLRDLKTGALHRPYQSQLGGYSLLAKSNTVITGIDVTAVAIDWIGRAPKTKPQPPVKTESYGLVTCERAAFATVQRIKHDLTTFRASGDPWAFAANPMNMMCQARFCEAHGTSFCDMWHNR